VLAKKKMIGGAGGELEAAAEAAAERRLARGAQVLLRCLSFPDGSHPATELVIARRR